MILTSGQVDNLSREELIEAYTITDNTIEYITDQLNGLNSWFKDFIKKCYKLNSELLISKNCNSLLLKCVTNLGQNAPNYVQYVGRETIEIISIPHSVLSADLENKVCLVFYLTGVIVIFKPVIRWRIKRKLSSSSKIESKETKLFSVRRN